MNVENLILNTVIVSLLEEGFVYGFCLRLLILFKVVEFDKRKFLKSMAIGVPATAITSNILRSYFINNVNILLLIMSLFTIFVLMIIQQINIIQIHKVIASVFLTIIALQATEIYIPLYLFKANLSWEDFKNSAILCFYVTIPERLAQYFILSAAYVGKFDDIDVKFNKAEKRIFICILSFGFLYYCLLGQLFYSGKIIILNRMDLAMVISLVSFPLIIIWVYYFGVYIKNRKIIIIEKRLKMLKDACNYCKLNKRKD